MADLEVTVNQAGLKLALPPKCWDCRPELKHGSGPAGSLLSSRSEVLKKGSWALLMIVIHTAELMAEWADGWP